MTTIKYAIFLRNSLDSLEDIKVFSNREKNQLSQLRIKKLLLMLYIF